MCAKTRSDNKYAVNEVYQSYYFTLVLDKRDRKDESPVAVRITHKSQRRYFRSGLRLTDEDFEKLLRASKGTFYEYREEQKAYFNKILTLSKRMIDDGTFSFDALTAQLTGSFSQSFNSLFDEKVKVLMENDQVGTAVLYNSTNKRLKKFAKGEVPFSRVTTDFIEAFKKALEKDGLSQTSIAIYLRNVRAICNMAIYRNYMKPSQYPFSTKGFETNKVKIKAGAKRKERFLPVSEILKLWSYNKPENKQTPRGRQLCQAVAMWMFSYLGNGMNLLDIAYLTYDDHYFRTKGREFSFKRKKTERTVNEELIIYVPVIDEMRMILDEYAAKPVRGERVFPNILKYEESVARVVAVLKQENKNIRKRLEKVCDDVGIERISMTWARHSFQTNLSHKTVPVSYIDQAVGHTDDTVTDGYIGMYSTEDRFRYNSLLLEPDKEA